MFVATSTGHILLALGILVENGADLIDLVERV
jgi:hypothetical protein